MKLMFYINTIAHGGAERVIVNLATQLSERGHECILVTSFITPEFEYKYGEKVQRIAMTERRILNPLKRNIKYIFTLRKAIKSYQPDSLIAFMPEANFRSLVATFGLKTKTIISIRSNPSWEYKTILNKLLAKTLYRIADGIVFQTEEARQWFPKKIRNRSTIIINQVDKLFYETKYSGERHDIVVTGRLIAPKNHSMLIRAYMSISDKVSDRLLIYGEGKLQKVLEQQISSYHLENKIQLMGTTDDVPNAIKSAKLFVLSSDFEGMPNALMEAMALGLPCISTDCPCGGPRILFGEDLKDCLVPVNNKLAMATKIQELLADEEKRDKIARLCRQQAMLFRPEVIITRWEDYIRKIVNK